MYESTSRKPLNRARIRPELWTAHISAGVCKGDVMKRIACLCLGLILLVTVASAQSLGEAARKNRSEKKRVAARVYTDEDLASNVTYNNGAASGPTDADKAATDSEKKEADTSASDGQEKAVADWKARFAEQK